MGILFLFNSNEETKGDEIAGIKRKNKRNYKENLSIKIDLSRQEQDNASDPISSFIQEQALSAPIQYSKRKKADDLNFGQGEQQYHIHLTPASNTEATYEKELSYSPYYPSVSPNPCKS